MQAATASLVSTPPATGRLFVRFFWKESRRLRGMAIGVAVLATLLMLFIKTVTPPGVWPDTFSVVAFGGAAMLAIAAAVTLFSVEREEGTADVLRVLPTNRSALLAGKVAAAVLVVAIAALVLCAVAYGLGSEQGNQVDVARYAPQGCLVIFEALAWGLLASLICPNPLVAAVLGIAATSASSQVAMAITNPYSHGYTLRDFESATTARLALAGVALLIDGWLGLRWPGDTAKAPTSRPRSRALSNWFARLPKLRLGAFTRLVWQSFRQSWLTMAAVVALGVFLTASFALITSFFTNDGVVPWFVPSFGLLFAPALVGSVVFRADQRGRRYRFLSEHAAKPRTLWLARQATWLAPLVLVGGVAMLVAWRFGAGVHFESAVDRVWSFYWSPDGVDAATLRGRLVDDTLLYRFALLVAATAWWAVFAAYAVGQAFSMFVRSDILAGMLALLCSVVLSAWVAVVVLWRLPPLWCVAPLGVGAMLATWLRVRDWVFERHALWRWTTPFVAVIAPVALVGWLTPQVRQAQLSAHFETVNLGDARFGSLVTEAVLEQKRGRDVADAYGRLAGEASEAGAVRPLQGEQLEEFIELSRLDCRLPYQPSGLPIAYLRDLGLDSWVRSDEASSAQAVAGGLPRTRSDASEVAYRGEDLDADLERLLACRRAVVQQTNGAPEWVQQNPRYLSDELLAWATAEGQTPELILKAVRELEAIELTRVQPAGRLLDEYLRVRDVLRGNESPDFMGPGRRPPTATQWLAYAAHLLPSEQARSERALEILAAASMDYLSGMTRRMFAAGESEQAAARWRSWLRSNSYWRGWATMLADCYAIDPWGGSYSTNLLNSDRRLLPRVEALALAGTSYFAAEEFGHRRRLDQYVESYVGAYAWRRAERVRLSLLAYRLQEGEYPNTLARLVPDYLAVKEWVRDPYSAGPFGYAPEGFDPPVWVDTFGSGQPDFDSEAGTPMLWCLGVSEASPTTSRLVVEIGSDGNRIERAFPLSKELGEEFTVVGEVTTLTPRARRWGSDHFWMPLPR